MSDPKRGGSRDISELKQRLGLKKTASTGAAGAQPRSGVGPSGVVPPPGMVPPTPPPPKPPNAAEDPFGAMNAMVATAPRAPEMVIVHDGRPVEHVGASKRGAAIAKLAVPAVVALALGIAIGQLAKSANLYNLGIREARTILGDDRAAASTKNVKNVKKALSELDTVLDEMRGKNDYRPDAAADKRLSDLVGKLEVDATKVFNTASAVDPEAMGLILKFYAGAAEVRGMLDSHVKSAKYDDQAFAAGKAASAAAQLGENENAALAGVGALRYAALIQAPSESDRGAEFGVKLVEIGQPYCGGPAPSTTGKCERPELLSGYAYRSEPGAPWIKGELQVQGSDSIPGKKLVLLLPNATRDALIKGGQAGASELFYAKRLKAVSERTKKLIEEANKLEQRLQAEASKPPRFSFFL